jgi:hypothetical protein
MTTNRESGNSGKWCSPSFLETSASLHQLECAHLEPGNLTSSSVKAPWTVEGAVAKLPGGTPVADSSSPVPFFHMLERLKTTKREGWRRSGIPQYVLPNLLLSSELTTSQLRVDLRPYASHGAHYYVCTLLSILEDQCPTLHKDGTDTRLG